MKDIPYVPKLDTSGAAATAANGDTGSAASDDTTAVTVMSARVRGRTGIYAVALRFCQAK